ncbi:MAG TPA: SDR family oxidoreductase [Methylomirabilota bacterium]|jgi:nucleoside-diphosphate-sugar epimerase|nr:SDR family oxidoreductase [Methylomirabilota bacterium]
MRVLVTGNLGYVGTVMTPLLERDGHEVRGLDTGYFDRCVMGDLGASGVSQQLDRDIREVEPADVAGVDAVIHLAGLSNDPTGDLDPRLTEAINLEGTVRLAEVAKRAGVSRFLFASSCSIYGQGDGGALTEAAEFNPLTAYARSKVAAEAALHRLADSGFSPVYLRNATAYGFSPRLRFDIVVNNLTGWAFTTGEVKLLSDGRAWRPLVHVEDMSRAFAATLRAPRDRVHDQALNVGREQDNFQIRDIAEAVARELPRCRVTFAEGASADSRNYNVSFARIRERLPEFQPQWDVAKGIRQLHAAFKRNGLTYEQFAGREFTRLKQLQHLLEREALRGDLMWNPVAKA